MSVRICICLDFDTDEPAEAYGSLTRFMNGINWESATLGGMQEGWESTDEWYGKDGVPLTEKECQEARNRYFTRDQYGRRS